MPTAHNGTSEEDVFNQRRNWERLQRRGDMWVRSWSEKSFKSLTEKGEKEEKKAILLMKEHVQVKAQDWSLQGSVMGSEWLQHSEYRVHGKEAGGVAREKATSVRQWSVLRKFCVILWVPGGWGQYIPFIICFLTKTTMRKTTVRSPEKLTGGCLSFSRICVIGPVFAYVAVVGGPHSCCYPIYLELIMSERLWTWSGASKVLCSLSHTKPF